MTAMAETYPATRFGLPDDAFVYRAPEKGLITKREIRVISLARMELAPDSVVWDIGAGSGAVAIEAARLCPQGRVFAIEKNPDDFDLVRTNCERFGVTNLTGVCGKAPAGLEAWPDPDAVFIGGSGGVMAELLDVVTRRLRPGGRVVINLVTLDNLAETVGYWQRLDWPVDYTLVQIARSKPIANLTRYEALNPVTIVVVKKPGEGRNPAPLVPVKASAMRRAGPRDTEPRSMSPLAGPSKPRLSSRQRAILSLLAEGLAGKEIGAALKISPRTVETYLERLRVKWNAKTTNQLIAMSLDAVRDRQNSRRISGIAGFPQ